MNRPPPREPVAVLCYPGTDWRARVNGREVGYKSRAAWSDEERDALIADGWSLTLEEMLASVLSPPPAVVPEPVAAVYEPEGDVDDVPADDAPPTRAELEEKAQELGIKVDRRWGDRRLLEAIEAALAAKE